MQLSILISFSVLATLAGLVFIYVYISSKRATEPSGILNPLRVRFWFALILLVAIGLLAAFTIPRSPYYLFAETQPTQTIYVGALQFQFILSDDVIDPKELSGISNLILPLDEVIEFRVTSLDVNHGLAIYNPGQQLIAQTQAMPGYVNRLRWKFSESGTYTIYCLEYCGVAHQVMKTSFTVK